MRNQRGFAHLLVIAIILVGLVAAVYLVVNGQSFFPSAQQDSSGKSHGQGEISFSFQSGPSIYTGYPNTILPRIQYNNETLPTEGKDAGGEGRSIYHESIDMNESELSKTEKYPYITYAPKQEFPVQVVVRSDLYATSKFDAKVSYPADLLEIVRIEPEMKDPNRNCTQVEVEACTYEAVFCGNGMCNNKICQKFGNSCMVPDGWKIQPTPNNCVADMKVTLKDQDYASDSIIVGFKDGVSEGQINDLIYGNGLKYTKFNSINAAVVRLPDTSAIDWICKFKANDIISYAEPNYIVSAGGGNATTDTGTDRMTNSETSANVTSSNGATSTESSIQNNGGQYTEERIKRRMVPKTLISNWTSQKYDNVNGILNLTGESKGGLFTIYNQPPVRMATVIFRAKKEGKGMLKFMDDSAIYQYADNANVLQQKGTLGFAIRNNDNGGGGMCDRYIAPCNPNQQAVYDPNSSPNCPSFKCVDEKTPIACPLAIPNCGPNEELEDMRNLMDMLPGSQYPQCPLYRCVPKRLECKAAPQCINGESLTIEGVENGCTKYSCFKPQGRVCEQPLPSCPNDQAVVSSIDDKDGCRSYSCVYPPMIRKCTTEIINCSADQQMIYNGIGSDGCQSYSCVYIGNPQVQQCDPNKSIVIGDGVSGESRIICEQTDAEGNKQTISYSFGDLNKDGSFNFNDLSYFFTSGFWQ